MIRVIRQSILFILIVFISINCFSQPDINRSDHNDLPFYFGMTMGYSDIFLNIRKSTKFIQSDSILTATALHNKGINIGLMATLRVNERFDFRVNPQLIIGGMESVKYKLNNTVQGEAGYEVQNLPSTWISLPLQGKFNSDRLGNFSMYLLGGIKYNYDISANAGARTAKDRIQLKNHEWGVEAGIGCSIYLPFTVVSPEIKISSGLSDIHQLNPALQYSNIIDKITSRMIVFSIHFED